VRAVAAEDYEDKSVPDGQPDNLEFLSDKNEIIKSYNPGNSKKEATVTHQLEPG